jgi:hypothetical protein
VESMVDECDICGYELWGVAIDKDSCMHYEQRRIEYICSKTLACTDTLLGGGASLATSAVCACCLQYVR